MKLLLTSAGITNQQIADAFIGLVGKDVTEIAVAFIPTAANVEIGDKGWLIDDLIHIRNLGVKSIDIVDTSALSQSEWLPRLESADVIVVGGGNTFHLMRKINESGLSKHLSELLKTRTYVGISAGSMVTNPDLSLNVSQLLYGEDLSESENMEALNLVDFYIFPHLNSQYFPKLREQNINEVIPKSLRKSYVLDDQIAIEVLDGEVRLVGGGKSIVL